MKLFDLDDSYNVVFDPEIFLIKDFADLRDSRKKNIALIYKELAFIYFYCDLRSDFQFQTDKKERVAEVKRFVKLPENWKIDKHIETCMEVYNYLSQTVTGNLLKGAYKAVDKITKNIEDLDLDERDKSNKPIWNQKQLADVIKTIPDILKAIQEAEAQYMRGQEANDKLRGDKIKTLYEDGFTKKSS